MAARQQRNKRVDPRVLIGLVLLAFGLLQVLAILGARPEQLAAEHFLSLVGILLSGYFIQFGLGFLWTLVLPAIVIQTGWAMLRSRPVLVRVPRFGRQLLFVLAAAFTHALVRVFLLGGGAGADPGGGWHVGVLGGQDGRLAGGRC